MTVETNDVYSKQQFEKQTKNNRRLKKNENTQQ